MAYQFTDISIRPIYWLLKNIGYRFEVETNKILVIGYWLQPNIGYQLSAKSNQFAIPGGNTAMEYCFIRLKA